MYKIFYQPMDSIQVDYMEKLKSWDMEGQQYHNTYEIYMLTEGKRKFVINGQEVMLSPWELLIMKPYCLHCSKTETEYITRSFFNISSENLKDFLDMPEIKYLMGDIPSCVIPIEGNDREITMEYFRQIKERNDMVSPVADKLMKCYIVQFFDYLKKLVQKASIVIESQNLVIRPEMQAALEFIHANYSDESFGLDDVIEHIHMSKSRFCELFRAATGQTFLKYLNMIRIRPVEKIIRTTDRPLSRVAEEHGFSSVAHMTRIFNGVFGMSPTEYRREKKK